MLLHPPVHNELRQLYPYPKELAPRVYLHPLRYLRSKRLSVVTTVAVVALVLILVHAITPGAFSNLPPYPAFPASQGLRSYDNVDWSRFAYAQYVTNTAYLCNSVMIFEALARLGSKADRLLMYPSSFQLSSEDADAESVESRLLRKARDKFNVRLSPVRVERRASNDGGFWGSE